MLISAYDSGGCGTSFWTKFSPTASFTCGIKTGGTQIGIIVDI
jgi:hypothetical protein